MDTERGPGGAAPVEDLSERELRALHEAEVGLEWLRRAEGNLLAFHHAVGHGMDHFEAAERELRAAGHDDLADRVRDDLLPRGVTADGRWSYALVEEYRGSFLPAIASFESAVRSELADGKRHVAERRQRTAWRERSRRECWADDGE